MNQFEVVGLLAVDPAEPGALRLAFLRNRATVPCKWELRKTDITEGRRVLEGSGLRAVGLFHSHPVSPAKLGLRDRRGTPTGWKHLVYDVCALELRLYVVRRRRGRREVEEVPLTVDRSA
jgi:proteasome lid subunit RPN8/RPN11